jgi:hypothetical protein
MTTEFDFDCSSEKDMQAAIDAHAITQAVYEANVKSFFSGTMPAGKAETYASINYNDGLSCNEWSLQIKQVIVSNTNADLKIAMDKMPISPGEIQYSIQLLKGLKQLKGANNFLFSKAKGADGKGDAYFIAMKDTAIIGYFNISTQFP